MRHICRTDQGDTMSDMRLSLCSSCQGERDRDQGAERAALAEALARAGLSGRVELVEHACFGACATPVALALQGPGQASYVFSDLDVVADADDIAATCRVYLDSPGGWIADARPCGRLRQCLLARIPAYST
ncbi:DUF1636 family protein [Ruegeria pomeroyi]|uniref:DUF1636 family protein n=2 Tax=Ruegeria pomeroyi TaxID=89184 RepID=A0A9Q3WK18_9RHOB|nr:DUF1636 family protein [Ruegeria pomeroyi]MCE8554041.1 DUF1636 family protein [Ruegeria pomeroyi]